MKKIFIKFLLLTLFIILLFPQELIFAANLGKLNDSCGNDSKSKYLNCESGLSCAGAILILYNSGAIAKDKAGVCKKVANLNQACNVDSKSAYPSCFGDLRCTGSAFALNTSGDVATDKAGTCKKAASLNEACGTDTRSKYPSCFGDLRCVGSIFSSSKDKSGTCKKAAKLNESCGLENTESKYPSCKGLDLYCASGKCKALAKLGESCKGSGSPDCDHSLGLQCVGAKSSAPGKCKSLVVIAGSSCGPSRSAADCDHALGLECISNRCQLNYCYNFGYPGCNKTPGTVGEGAFCGTGYPSEDNPTQCARGLKCFGDKGDSENHGICIKPIKIMYVKKK